MTGLHKAQRQMRNYSAAKKSEEITGRLSQSMKVIPKYLSSMNWCQNTVNYLIYYGSVKKWMFPEVLKTNLTYICWNTWQILQKSWHIQRCEQV